MNYLLIETFKQFEDMDIESYWNVISGLFMVFLNLILSIGTVIFDFTPLGKNTLGNEIWFILALASGVFFGHKYLLPAYRRDFK